MDFKLKGGVLIIGSLYWQADRDRKGDNIRENWRNRHLDMSAAKNVPVPIRYGRFSGKPEKRDRTYTMVFDNTLAKDTEYGQAKAVPFSNQPFTSFREIKAEVKDLSEVEGGACCNFIKGSTRKNPAWCVCGIAFNPYVPAAIKESILEQWDAQLRKNLIGYSVFSEAPELYSLKLSGELDIPWPSECDELDFLIATSTRLQHEDKSTNWPSIEEIANWADREREYFSPNREKEIFTFQDKEILHIKGNNPL